MNLNNLPSIVERSKKRVGRGMGSGKGSHTAGRGQKGQKSRGNKVGIEFFGTKMKKSLLKRIPMLRGKGKFKAGPKLTPVAISRLNAFKAGESVDLESLVKSNVVKARDAQRGVKIVNGGKLEKALAIKLPTTKGAGNAIIKAGGSLG